MMDTILKWGNMVAFVLMVGVNTAANMIPIGGNTTGEVSAKYRSLFTPAPFTFAIWGLIYFMMLLFVLLQMEWIGNRADGALIRKEIGPWFIISCLLNIAWIFSWHYRKMGLSLALIVMLFISLLLINGAISHNYENTSVTRMLVGHGFDLYFGWITAATLANACVSLVATGWSRFGLSEELWTIIVLLIGAIIGVIYSQGGFGFFSTLAIMWAYFGIMLRHLTTDEFGVTHPNIVTIALIGILIMLISVVFCAVAPAQKQISDATMTR